MLLGCCCLEGFPLDGARIPDTTRRESYLHHIYQTVDYLSHGTVVYCIAMIYISIVPVPVMIVLAPHGTLYEQEQEHGNVSSL
jgi:hypothetical protein